MKFVETIRVQNGVPDNLDRHQLRFGATAWRFFGKALNFPDLSAHLPRANGLFKLRIVYGETVEQITVEPYLLRCVKTLRLVASPPIDYRYKSLNRADIDALFAQRAQADDVLISINARVCDTSYSNVVFDDGKQLITPTSFLLNGTRRQQLLAEGKIVERPVNVPDIAAFKRVFLINAMMDLDNAIAIEPTAILSGA